MPITSKPSEASLPRGKYVYYFGNGQADGTGAMRALLGGKGYPDVCTEQRKR
ncbi:MAG TPA: hypothetical protein VK673_04245 [Chthoniobacterales bacterium]|nr:hypothetical protein [Chthoniobacterales bacterium]